MAKYIIYKVTPVYPQEAKDERIQGKVVLNAIIGKDGAVENLVVVSGPNELQQSALDAVRQWKYKPFLVNGDPVEVTTTINVIYSLAN
jgi:TonB family protein